MPGITQQVDVDECPVDACEQHVDLCLITTRQTKLATQNMIHDRVCILPTEHEGEPAAYIVYHTDAEPTTQEPTTETAADLPDPDELSGDRHAVYQTILQMGGTAKQGELGGKLLDWDIHPNAVKPTLRDLVEDGYLDEIEDAVYKIPQT